MTNRVASPPACMECGITDPPPEETCGGLDHYIGIHPDACPYCHRLRAACTLRPCTTFRGGSAMPVCKPMDHDFQQVTVTKGGKPMIVSMCQKCGLIENPNN